MTNQLISEDVNITIELPSKIQAEGKYFTTVATQTVKAILQNESLLKLVLVGTVGNRRHWNWNPCNRL
jgi:hypothetical protein